MSIKYLNENHLPSNIRLQYSMIHDILYKKCGGLIMKQLTVQQQKVLDFIQTELQSKGYPPSIREICNGVGLSSSSTVHAHLTSLERAGYIRRDPIKSRTIEILEHAHKLNHAYSSPSTGTNIIYVPVVGRVTAGEPILAVENIEGTFPIPRDISSGNEDNLFILRVKGDSMINAGILNHDYIVVRQQQNAENGDIIVALLGEDATVKRFYKEANRIRLQPENNFMEPIYTQDVSIIGKVVSLLRKI